MKRYSAPSARLPSMLMAVVLLIVISVAISPPATATVNPQETSLAIVQATPIALTDEMPMIQAVERASPVEMVQMFTENDLAFTNDWAQSGNKSPSLSMDEILLGENTDTTPLSMSATVPDEKTDLTAQVMNANVNAGQVLKL